MPLTPGLDRDSGTINGIGGLLRRMLDGMCLISQQLNLSACRYIRSEHTFKANNGRRLFAIN